MTTVGAVKIDVIQVELELEPVVHSLQELTVELSKIAYLPTQKEAMPTQNCAAARERVQEHHLIQDIVIWNYYN